MTQVVRRWVRRAGAMLLSAGCGLTPFAAAASCGAGVYAVAPVAPAGQTATFEQRFTALRAADRYGTLDDATPPWLKLIDDIKHSADPSPELLARSYAMLAFSYDADDPQHGLPAAQEAERIVIASGLADRPFHAEILAVLASKETSAGTAQLGLTHSLAALDLANRTAGPDSWEAGSASMSVAYASNALGHYVEAERYAAAAETLALKCLDPQDPRVIGRISSHAAELGMAGRLEEALAEHERAVGLAVRELPESDHMVMYVLDNMGMSLRNANRLPEAEAVLRRAVDLGARYHAEDWSGRSAGLGKLANVLDAEGHHAEAEALWLKSEEFYLKTPNKGNPIAGGGAYRRSADAAQARGDLPLAISRRLAAIDIMAKSATPQHPELARARVEYASTLLLAGHAAEARTVADLAIVLVRAGLDEVDPKRMSAEIAYARIVDATSGPEAAYQLVLPIAKRFETSLLDESTSRSELINSASLYSGGFAAIAQFALETHRNEEAFRALQLANLSDIVLVNADVALRAATNDPASRALVKTLQDHVAQRQVLDRERSYAVSKHQSGQLAEIDASTKDNDAIIATTVRELDRVFPAYRTIGRPLPVTLAQFHARLAPDQVLIAPVSLADGTLTFAVTKSGLTWHKTNVPYYRVIALTGRVRSSIADAERSTVRNPRFDTDAARQLYHEIAPAALAPVFATHKSLLYYASGMLATIPPGLLVTGASTLGKPTPWLIRSHNVTVIPTLAAATTASGGGDTIRRFLGVGAPELGPAGLGIKSRSLAFQVGIADTASLGKLPSLPYAARELRRMATLFTAGHTRLMINAGATESAFKAADLKSFLVIAVATHGLLNGSLPGLTEPALVMTPPHKPTGNDDGLLTASEVAGLHLDADWVILSACDTASGSGAGSPTYSGLASAFMKAGARALLVSHWPVRDDAAAYLTVETVRESAKGVDRATALQHAILKLMADRSVRQSSNPAIWAPFVLIDR